MEGKNMIRAREGKQHIKLHWHTNMHITRFQEKTYLIFLHRLYLCEPVCICLYLSMTNGQTPNMAGVQPSLA